jgi:putative peptidoglycan lipid II flippase
MTLGLVTPAAVGLYLLAGPLIALIYERGAFLAADTAATASVLRGYAIASVGISLYRVLLPAFFALGDPYLPMRLSLGVLIVKVPIALLLCDTLGLGLIGLPLSHALTASAEVLVLVLVLRSRLGGWSEGFVGQLARIGLASALLAVLVAALRPWADGPWLLPICALGAVVYGLLGLLFGVRELRGIARRLLPPPPPGRGPPDRPPDRPPERL